MSRDSLLSKAAFALVLASVQTAAHANVVGSDSQNFNPAANRTDFVTVQSSGALPPGRFSLGLFLNSAVNSLPYADGEGQNRGRINDTLTGMDALIGAGVLNGLELGLALPFVAQQTVRDDETRGEFAERGNTGGRASAKWTFLKSGGLGLATIATGTIGRTQEDPYQGAGAPPIYHLELAADQKLGRAKLGANLGYRYREPGEQIEGALVEPMKSQGLASVAFAYSFVPSWTAVSEIYGSRPMGEVEDASNRSTANAEALLGLRHDLTPDLLVHAGVGSELMQGLATPDWRAYAGLVTEIGMSDRGPQARFAETKKKKSRKPKAIPVSTEVEESYPELPTTAPAETFVLHNINFEYDSDYRVLPGAFNELDKLAQYLATQPYTKIVVEGHTDWHGSDEYNDDLSMRRAKTVRRRLIKVHGLDAERLAPVGYGEQRPMTDDTSDAGRQINRRVEIKIYRD